MKASIVFATGLILVTGAIFSSSNIAHAGVAGSAGSISADFAAGNALSATAGAVAVGKAGAITTGTTTATEIAASAVGYAGQLAVSEFNNVDVNYGVSRELDNSKNRAQGNTFAGADKSSTNLVPATAGVTLK